MDHNLIVFDELPEDGVLTDSDGFPNQSMRDKFHGDWNKIYNTDFYYYYCEYCKGYIKGTMIHRGENSLAPLSGRLGTSSSCRRCSRELDFYGVVS